jgi:hypothetical protein
MRAVSVMRVQAFEVADQEQTEIASRRQARSAFVRIEPLGTPRRIRRSRAGQESDSVARRTERMGGTPGQVLGRHPRSLRASL